MHALLWHGQLFGHTVDIWAYRTFLRLFAAAFLIVLLIAGRRMNVKPYKMVIVWAVLIVSMAAGSRLFYWALHPEEFRTLTQLLDTAQSGMAIAGGFLLVAGLVPLFARVLEINLPKLWDALSVAFIPGIILIRIGCFLNGCCYGTPTTLPWAVRFPAGSYAYQDQHYHGIIGTPYYSLPVHPTQLYEILGVIMLGVVVIWAIKRLRSGSGFAVFIGGYALYRLGTDWFRQSMVLTEPRWFYPALFLAVIIASATWLYRNRATQNEPLPKDSKKDERLYTRSVEQDTL
ncbi:MAG: prolipoprotein diacylglyceryl transferase [Solirubrobacterales bacterium]